MACWTRSKPCDGSMKTSATLEETQRESQSLALELVPPVWTFSSSPTTPRVRFFSCPWPISSHILHSKGINISGQCVGNVFLYRACWCFSVKSLKQIKMHCSIVPTKKGIQRWVTYSLGHYGIISISRTKLQRSSNLKENKVVSSGVDKWF